MFPRLFSSLIVVVLASVLQCALRAESPTEPVYDGKPLSAWIQQLKSPQAKDRNQAVEAIRKLVKKTEAAAPVLFRQLTEQDHPGRDAGLQALVALGPTSVPTLTAALWDEDWITRGIAAYALSALGSRGRPAIPSLLHGLEDEEPPVRAQMVRALGEIGARSAIPSLLPMLQDKNTGVRANVLTALLALGTDSKVLLPHLLEALQAEEPELQGVALQGLAAIGPGAREAVPALRELLNNPKWADRHLLVAETLLYLHSDADAVSFLKRRVKDKGQPQRVRTAALLWRGARSPEGLAALAEVLRDSSDANQRQEAANAVNQIGPPAHTVRSALVPLLDDKNGNVRLAAIMALGRLGAHGKPAADLLARHLQEEHATVRLCAMLALWRVQQDRKVIPLLVAALQDKDVERREIAVTFLAEIGPDARDAAPALRALLDDKEVRLRRLAADALWRIAKHPDALRVLTSLLQNEDPIIRNEAAISLMIVGPAARPAVGALLRALWDQQPQVRSAAAEALGRSVPDSGKAIAALTALLASEEEEDFVHSAAVEALGLFGPEARSAVPVLVQRLRHPDLHVGVHAALALWHIARDPAGAAVAQAGLTHRKYQVRVVAAEALWRINQDPRAIPTLLTVLREAAIGDPVAAGNMNYMAARALGRIGPPAKAAIAPLSELLHADDVLLRSAVAQALKKINPASE